MTSPLQSPEIQAFATGFPLTLLHATVTVAILFAGATAYVLLTPHKEITLIREGNTAARSVPGRRPGRGWPCRWRCRSRPRTTVIDVALWGVATVIVLQLLIFRLDGPGAPRPAQAHRRTARWPPRPCSSGAKIATALIPAAAVAG